VAAVVSCDVPLAEMRMGVEVLSQLQLLFFFSWCSLLGSKLGGEGKVVDLGALEQP
jgi:hypothetical protein